ncbi:uncharacterized protein LOC117153268 isoform X2 [Bombus vancouverensis nearcticus]|uniref:uncharacterized protein LOC117153268 isoform X2 n=1 Tax=Bombus vancouverensis nearcticus TaxID=2705178 RepID=UPI00402BDB8D
MEHLNNTGRPTYLVSGAVAYSLVGRRVRDVLVVAGHEERVLRWPTLSGLIGERSGVAVLSRKKQGEEGKARGGRSGRDNSWTGRKMGQAWCKEKTTKAQDSKSSLDRVFVRCMHRIYPGLKEEGSVLGGATQRVTSSEIGYAGSPPRELLTRGRSIDSVDRLFQPSDWVDVNLEVPSTPRASSALTNLTVDTSLYPATTPTSSCSNLKDVTPIPPPRRRKRNKGRPLPPKPDEIAENSCNGPKRGETGDEPLYSSVRSPKSSGDEQEKEEEVKTDKHRSYDDAGRDGRRTKEIYEHKVNGTGRIISSDVVSGKRSFESSQHQRKESDEYEKFARNRTSKDSSTPNRVEKRSKREIEKRTNDSSRDQEKSSGNARAKNFSTVSLPNYDELDVARHRPKENDDHEQQQDKTSKCRRPVRSSTGSLPAESFLSPFSDKTSVRLEDYIPRSDSLTPYEVLEKLDCGTNGLVTDEFVRYDPNKPEDWQLGDVGNCELNRHRRLSIEDITGLNDEEKKRVREDDEDVVDFSAGREDERRSPLANVPRSPIFLEKPEAFGKTASPALAQPEYIEVDQNRSHLRYFDQPKLTDSCRVSCVRESSESKEPFFLDEAKHRSALDTLTGSMEGKPETDRSGQSRMTFARSLSNESEPNENTYEAKDLHSHATNLIRTISEESLPREMLEEEQLDDFFDAKLAKNVHNNLRKSLDDWKTNTPPPSPEPKIKSDILDADHSTLLKVLKEEIAEESNLSSMTPSLTELEAALSDMLEKEDSQEASKEENRSNFTDEQVVKKLELDVQRGSDTFNGKMDSLSNENGGRTSDLNVVDQEMRNSNALEIPAPAKQIVEGKKLVSGRKVSFCSWEESVANMETRHEQESVDYSLDLEKRNVPCLDDDRGTGDRGGIFLDVPPEKPSRLNRSLDDLLENRNVVPTPPRRRNRSVGVVKKEFEVAQNGTVSEHLSDDRLI